MSEENVVVTTTEVEAPEVVEANPVETQAREQGWVSKDEWVESGKSADEWRPAKEFVDRGELYKSLSSIKRELKQERAARESLQKHHQFVFEKAYSQAKADLKLEKRQAIREGDLERLEDVEDQIEQLDETHAKERAQFVQQTSGNQGAWQADMEEFVNRNPWYVTDEEMKDEADAIGFIYVNKGGKPAGLLKHVETQMKKKFPEKLGVRKAAPSPTANGDRTVRAKAETMQLDELETKIMKDLVRSGTMTEKEYIAELKKAKGIK